MLRRSNKRRTGLENRKFKKMDRTLLNKLRKLRRASKSRGNLNAKILRNNPNKAKITKKSKQSNKFEANLNRDVEEMTISMYR